MRPSTAPALEAFEHAAEARRKDVHSAARAAALADAREALERALAAVLARLPYCTRRVADLRPGRDGGHVHLAVLHDVALPGWARRCGQTLCGAAPGRPAPDRPVACPACLRQADRHVDAEPAPPELF
jgi:hypothetical protein